MSGRSEGRPATVELIRADDGPETGAPIPVRPPNRRALFALTGDPGYHSTSREFVSLIADRGDGQLVLDDGAEWAWVDSPMEGAVVTYLVDDAGSTAAWSVETLERLDEHQLAGRPSTSGPTRWPAASADSIQAESPSR